MFFRKAGLFLAIILLPVRVLAADIPYFTTVDEGSELAFEVLWDGAPLKGQFQHFEIAVAFHPEKLQQSRVDVVVYMESVSVGNADVQTTLPQKDWFDSSMFPKAVFHAEHFKSLGDNQYEAVGKLTLKGQTMPLTLPFTLVHFSASEAEITGMASLKRKDFLIGWENTDSVENEVNVHISLKAKP